MTSEEDLKKEIGSYTGLNSNHSQNDNDSIHYGFEGEIQELAKTMTRDSAKNRMTSSPNPCIGLFAICHKYQEAHLSIKPIQD